MEDRMGVFKYKIQIKHADSDTFEDVEPYVDTGAVYSQFSRSLLERLGYKPTATRRFRLADGSSTENPIAPVVMRIGSEELPVVCVMAEEDSEMLLGATALELFSLVPDTTNHTLLPMMAMRLTRLDVTNEQGLMLTMLTKDDPE